MPESGLENLPESVPDPSPSDADTTTEQAARPTWMLRRGSWMVGLLALLLGFALTIQLRVSSDDELLNRASREDLVNILDGLNQRAEALERDVVRLDLTRRELASGQDSGEAALEAAERQANDLAILAGTAPAVGPGVELAIADPDGVVPASILLSAVQELRDAGAEAIQISGSNGTAVRVVTSTSFLDDVDGALVDGRVLSPTYRIRAIGDPRTMTTAMGIPGGLIEEASSLGGRASVVEVDEALVDAVVTLADPQYARPS